MSNYECELTELVSEGSPVDPTAPEDGDMPVGWVEVTFARRMYNLKWLVIQQVKERMVQGLLQQLPPEIQAAEELAIRVQVDAQFAAQEAVTPRYEKSVETIFLSDSRDAMEILNESREMLGLQAMVFDEDEAEEPEETADNAEEGEEPSE